MAGPVYVYKRLWNPEIVVDPDGILPNKCKRFINNRQDTTYVMRWVGATQAAAEEFGTAVASEKDGTTTPFQITVKSSDALDDRGNAAGMVHSIALIGLSVANVQAYTVGEETPKTTVEVIHMDGLTNVLSTRYYLWVDHAYACEWGTGATHDAEGNITIESPALTVLFQITATYNESNGGTWHFPTGKWVRTQDVYVMPTSSMAVADGIGVTALYSGFDQALNDSNIVDGTEYYTWIFGGNAPLLAIDKGVARYTTSAAKVTWKEILLANSMTFDVTVFMTLHDQPFFMR